MFTKSAALGAGLAMLMAAGCIEDEPTLGTTDQAITWGTPDGDGHPYVGILVFDNALGPAWRCSGTLISPTVVLTAGHCTYGASAGRIWFDSNLHDTYPENGWPFAGGTAVEFDSINTHPDYIDGAFYLYDVGVVTLSEPVVMDTYGELADLGYLDNLATARGLQNQTFNPVGYGVQSIVPVEIANLIRHTADTRLVDVHGTQGVPAGISVIFSNNANTGGTCFGDSGGPIFIGGTNTVAAVTSFGINPNCVGTGGGYRVDTADDQAFINSFLD